MNELILRVNQQVGLLDWNFDEINRGLTTYLEKYKNLIVGEDDIKEAKAIKQELGRVRTQIEDRRKAAKVEFCKPYEDFAAQVKEVTSKIDEVTGNIDEQLKAYDTAEKNKKKELIRAYWENECTTSPVIPFERVFEPKMLNKTTTEKQWKATLDARKKDADMAFASIANIDNQQKRDYVLTTYMEELDYGKALHCWELYADQLRKAEEFRQRAAQRAQATIEKLNVNATRPAEPQNSTTQPQNAPQAAIPKPEAKPADSTIYHRCMEVWGTREQIIAIADFMNRNGIKFRKVELKNDNK